jgi:hypothetical protein
MPRYRNKLWLDPAYGLGLMMPGIEGGLRLMGHTGEGPGSAIAVYALEGDAGTSVGAVWKTDAGSAVTEETCVALLRSRSLS